MCIEWRLWRIIRLLFCFRFRFIEVHACIRCSSRRETFLLVIVLIDASFIHSFLVLYGLSMIRIFQKFFHSNSWSAILCRFLRRTVFAISHIFIFHWFLTSQMLLLHLIIYLAFLIVILEIIIRFRENRCSSLKSWLILTLSCAYMLLFVLWNSINCGFFGILVIIWSWSLIINIICISWAVFMLAHLACWRLILSGLHFVIMSLYLKLFQDIESTFNWSKCSNECYIINYNLIHLHSTI